jgi:xylulokinase
MGVDFSEMYACGGGGTSRLWRQMLSDTYGCPVKTVKSKEGPALGVAILAAVGAGLYPTVKDACSVMVQSNDPQSPDMKNHEEYSKYHRIYKQLYKDLKQTYKDLAALG